MKLPKGLYRDDNGRLVIGRRLSVQDEWRVIEVPRKCSRCRRPTIITTKRGRPVHPACEGWTDHVDPAPWSQIVFGVAADLSARVIEDNA